MFRQELFGYCISKEDLYILKHHFINYEEIADENNYHDKTRETSLVLLLKRII